MNPLLDTAATQAFLDGFPSAARRRGKNYYQEGAVLRLACPEPGLVFMAVVRGGEDYEVTFEYDAEARSWWSECTCPVEFECKHAYAAMLALSANAANFSGLPPSTTPRRTRKSQSKKPAPREAPQPPPSPLVTALRQSLGRALKLEEIHYLQRIQWVYDQVRLGHHMTGETLHQLAPELQDRGWNPLELWPKPPTDDLQFWRFCAWELRRRGVGLPKFMETVTDLSTLEPVMRAWERQKAIAHWRAVLESTRANGRPEPEPVDLRLLVLPGEVRVQWRSGAQEPFKDLKQAHLRRLAEAHERGDLALAPEAAALWSAIYTPYDFFTPCNYAFERPETARMLSRALRAPGLNERVLTADGRPLARPAEPLRYRLEPAHDESEDYELGLVLADGSPAPPILLALRGHPTLHLSEKAVYEGPSPHELPTRGPVRIPAPAMESAAGVSFLQGLKVELPPRLSDRTRRVTAAVKLVAELKPAFPGSQTEAVFLHLTARLEHLPEERCGAQGWFTPADLNRTSAPRPAKPAATDGFIPLVDRSVQEPFPGRLEALGAKWEDYPGRWRVALNKKFPELFVSWLASLPPEVEVQLKGELATLREAALSGSVQLDLEEAGVDWFDLKVVLKVTDTTLTPEELRLLLNAGGGYVRLGKKGWRRLQFDLAPEDDERLAHLGLNPRDFTAEAQRLHALQLADEAARRFLPEPQVERLQRRAAELKTRVTPPVPAGISASLRPYQVEGFHFLAYLTANRFGGVLADDMGLGKTLQALTWLAWVRGQSDLSLLPSLVVCPKSVMDNWRAEAQRFCGGLRVRPWQGEEADALEAARAEADLIVVNYAQLRSLSPAIAQHRWHAVILDEAQYIKNPDSQTAQAARALQAEHRLALTGTPIENRLLDLWSIFAFAMPGVLGNRTHFARRYAQDTDPLARRRLAARVRPFLLRRLKAQVAQDLPDRVEEDLFCEMEKEQKTLYRAEFKRAQQLLLRVKTQKELNEQRFNFLTSLLRLRQICCHPALVSQELRQAESAKLNALLDLLETLLEEGHKVLVFSQFVGMLDLLRETVQARQWTHFYLAGATENRGELVGQFQATQGAAVFLISLKAGGFGLNLTAASYVVLFDPWWNPAVEMQAIDRTHRIGQTSKVIAYRLLIRDSIEQKIRQLQHTKAALAQDVLGEEAFARGLTLEDFRFLFAEE